MQGKAIEYAHTPLGYDTKTLIDRLRGHYRTPITDGLGPAGGEEPDNAFEHVRTFQTPPIQHEAAARLEAYEAALREIANINGSQFVGTQDDLLRARAIARKALGE